MTEPSVPTPMAAGKRQDDVLVLAQNGLLSRVSATDLGELLELLDQVALTKGTVVVREGDVIDTMYFLLEGVAMASRGGVELGALQPGASFGERALLGEARSPWTIEARSILRLARLSRSRFLSLATSHPRAALHLLQSLATGLADQLVTMTDRVGLLLRQRSLPRRATLRVRCRGEVIVIEPGTLASTVLGQDGHAALVVAATIDKKPASLDAQLMSESEIGVLTTAEMEGRRVFERSAGLLVLEAARLVAPSARLQMGPSLDEARLVRVAGAEEGLAAAVGRALSSMVAQDAPLGEELWAAEEARALFEERGWQDAAEALLTVRSETVNLLTCGATLAPAAGPVVPRASLLDGITVSPHAEGLLLHLGKSVTDQLPIPAVGPAALSAGEARAPRWGSPMSRDMLTWLETMRATSTGAFNAACVSGKVGELIHVAEGFHEKHIGRLADAIFARKNESSIVAVAGPSSSGKTTFLKRLKVQLEVLGLHPVGLSLDDYYVDRDKTPRDEHGELDFESLYAVDLALLQDHLSRLLGGERVKTARFDFTSGKGDPSGGAELSLGKDDLLVLEGIHGLDPLLLGERIPRACVFGIFVHPALMLPIDRLNVVLPEDVRLLRRIVRDRHGRNYTAAESISRWPSVRRGEQRWIYPHFANADAVFDTSLVYEVGVLKVFAERYLLEVKDDDPAFSTAFRLRQLIDQYVAIYPDHVPPTSLLREFIGGSSFDD